MGVINEGTAPCKDAAYRCAWTGAEDFADDGLQSGYDCTLLQLLLQGLKTLRSM